MKHPENKEQLRTALVVFLADRPTARFSVQELTRRIRAQNAVDVPFEESHVADALALLDGFGLVQKVNRPLSGLYDYQITSEGVVFKEKNYA